VWWGEISCSDRIKLVVDAFVDFFEKIEESLCSHKQKRYPATRFSHISATMTDREPTLPSSVRSFLSGGVGGICSTMIGHPLDLVKVRMQTMTGGSASTMSVLKETFVKDGVRGLYRGVQVSFEQLAILCTLRNRLKLCRNGAAWAVLCTQEEGEIRGCGVLR